MYFYTERTYSRRSKYNQCQKYNRCLFPVVYNVYKKSCSFFLFFFLNFKEFDRRNKKEKFERSCFLMMKINYKKLYFSVSVFLSPFSSVANNFRWILSYILICLWVPNTAVKNRGCYGQNFFLNYSAWKMWKLFFPKLVRKKYNQ